MFCIWRLVGVNTSNQFARSVVPLFLLGYGCGGCFGHKPWILSSYCEIQTHPHRSKVCADLLRVYNFVTALIPLVHGDAHRPATPEVHKTTRVHQSKPSAMGEMTCPRTSKMIISLPPLSVWKWDSFKIVTTVATAFAFPATQITILRTIIPTAMLNIMFGGIGLLRRW